MPIDTGRAHSHTGITNPQSPCNWGRIMKKQLEDEAERDLEWIKKKLETLSQTNLDSR